MQSPKIRVLLVEDDKVDYLAFVRLLKSKNLAYDHVRAGSVAEGKKALLSHTFDVVLLDYSLGDGTAFDLFNDVPKNVPIIIVTGSGDEEVAVRAMKSGAADYVIKDQAGNWVEMVPLAVLKAIKSKEAEELERRVAERTRELALLNMQLKAEISNRELMSEALKASEEKYRLLVENSAEAVFVIQDGMLKFVNAKTLELSKFSKEELTSKPFYEFVHLEDRVTVMDHYLRLIEHDEAIYGLEFRFQDGKGDLRWGSVSAISIVWDGQASVLCFATDITDRKHLEEKVAEGERLLRHLVEAANDVIYITDEKGFFTYVNPSGLRLSGYSEEEVIGKHFTELIVSEYRKPTETFYKKQFAERIPNTYYEYCIITKQGETLWLGQQVQLLMKGDRILGFQSICRDITDRRKAEESLRESEERFRQLAESVDDIFMLIQPGDPYSFIYVSPAYERLTGGKVIDLYENPAGWLSVIHEEDRPRVAQMADSFIQGDGDSSGEFRIVKSGEEIRWIWATGFPIRGGEGRARRYAVTARDITQRKLDEERLEHLVTEIKDFAYIVSHDFRAPLINIKGFAGELKAAMEAVRPAVQAGLPRLNEKQKSQALSALAEDLPEALEFINSSVSRMDNLINAILDLSRVERRELSFELLNMNLLVSEALKSLSYQLSMANAKVSVGKLPECVADRLAMEQIVTNLLGNAMKFKDPSRPQQVSITGHQFPHESMFIVRDQGRGVESAYLSQIFQIFNRGSSQDVPGEGMGLAYVRALVRRHGGRIWCESQLDRGSTFTFTISNHLAKRPPDEQS
ncbi:MAG: PAS domain S-box protein [Desulfomonilaceae bacterium]